MTHKHKNAVLGQNANPHCMKLLANAGALSQECAFPVPAVWHRAAELCGAIGMLARICPCVTAHHAFSAAIHIASAPGPSHRTMTVHHFWIAVCPSGLV